MVGRTDGTTPMTLSLALKLQNVDVLNNIFTSVSDPRSPEYTNYLTRAELSQFAPAEFRREAVLAWLAKEGVPTTAVTETANRGVLRVTVQARQVEAMLSIQLNDFVHPTGRTIPRTLSHYTVPAEVSEHLDFVAGVTSFPAVRRNMEAPVGAPQVTPSILKTLYKISDVGSGKTNSSQGCAEFQGQAFSHADLATFEEKFDIPPQKVRRVYGPDTNTGATEANLDVQYIVSTSPGVPTDMWLDNNGTNGFDLVQWAGWVLDVEGTPLVWSISYGENMEAVSTDYASRLDAEFQKMAAVGVSIMVSSGDGGVWCRSVLTTKFQACFPAGLPSVTSVGATLLNSDSTESKVVSFSGGGFTPEKYFKQPTWQKDAVAKYLSNKADLPPSHYYDAGGRGIPDVSTQGVNFAIIEHGQQTGVSGTSASCPVFAAVISLLNDQRMLSGKKSLGFLNPFLYQNALNFRDIQEGSNTNHHIHGFKALEGWDPATGLGTPLYPGLKAAALAA